MHRLLFFGVIFDRVMLWAKHKHAQYYLAGLSFAESCVLPFPPPDVMLAPMSLAKQEHAWRYAAITTVMSVLGGVAGYLIGMFAIELIWENYAQTEWYIAAKTEFDNWGVWAVLLAAFSPIPYKLFTITAGALALDVTTFMLASFVGRGARFYLVAGLMLAGGEKMQTTLRKYVDWIGWIVVLLAIILYLVLRE